MAKTALAKAADGSATQKPTPKSRARIAAA